MLDSLNYLSIVTRLIIFFISKSLLLVLSISKGYFLAYVTDSLILFTFYTSVDLKLDI